MQNHDISTYLHFVKWVTNGSRMDHEWVTNPKQFYVNFVRMPYECLNSLIQSMHCLCSAFEVWHFSSILSVTLSLIFSFWWYHEEADRNMMTKNYLTQFWKHWSGKHLSNPNSCMIHDVWSRSLKMVYLRVSYIL